MEKTFRRKVTSLQVKTAVERMADNPEDIPWPCIAGPNMPENDPKVWKKPRVDMTSSLAFLRRELAAMQLQDRAIHKQLLKLNSAILNLKSDSESWEQDERSENESEIEAVCYPTETSSAITKVEVVTSRTQVSHSKQDSGIMTDAESGDEEKDVFETEPPKPRPPPVRSISVINLPSYHSSIDIDINNNPKRTHSARSNNTNSFHAFNLSIPRSRSYTSTEGQFHRVTSMPVINENPSQDSSSKIKGKAFAIYGFVNENSHASNNSRARGFPLDFKPLSRHESMPVISGYVASEQRSVFHHRSHTEPAQFQRGRFHSSFSGYNTQAGDRPVMRASSQMDLRRIDQQTIKPYRIYRTSSQVSLV